MSQVSSHGIEYRGSFLDIVPAVHYRVPFAQTVNQIACDTASRPDAIAVELGPGVAVAATRWLREIGVGPETRKSLPCMLGLKQQQRYIAPELREKATAMQLESGLPLEELPPDVLALELNYHSSLVLPLSPTDSIIEALRCALELDIPVYGVDLDEHAAIASDAILFPDTAAATDRVEAYLDENEGLLASTLPGRVNRRREYAMAARLKELLLNHKRVLFSGGLAHRKRLLQLIRAPEVLATTNIEKLANIDPADKFQRVVIHPALAVAYLDRLPAVVRMYERQRRHPLLGNPRTTSNSVLVDGLFDATLRHGIRNHLRNPNCLSQGAGKLSRMIDFPRLVKAHEGLSLREVPSVASTLRCAGVFISESFAVSVAKTFFKFPWAQVDDYEDCKLLAPCDESQFVVRGEGISYQLKREAGIGKIIRIDSDGRPFENSSTQEPEAGCGRSAGYHFTWTPWEALVTGLCDDAIVFGLDRQPQRVSEAFTGSMQRGIAFKETLRARARGDRTIQVYVEPPGKTVSPADPTEGWPVVWIFDNKPRGDSVWSDLIVPLSWIEPFLSHDSAPGDLYKSSDTSLSSLVCFQDESRNPQTNLSNSVVHASTLRGMIVFGPVFHHDQQYARWLELSRGLRNPLFSRSSPQGVPACLSQHCDSMGTPLGRLSWQTDIVRMAIPYGGRHITVVAPRHFNLDSRVFKEAARLGKSISQVSLDRFSDSDVQRAQTNLMVLGTGQGNSPQYTSDAKSSIDEKHKCFARRMPEKWERFGL
jgi:hypothetical protein